MGIVSTFQPTVTFIMQLNKLSTMVAYTERALDKLSKI